MSVMLRWVFIAIVWFILSGLALYGIGAFITTSYNVFEWTVGWRAGLVSSSLVVSIFMTLGTSDVETHVRRKRAEEA